MAQAGIHALVGTAVRRWVPKAPWLMLGLVLGNIFPDMDNIAVAIATVAKKVHRGIAPHFYAQPLYHPCARIDLLVRGANQQTTPLG